MPSKRPTRITIPLQGDDLIIWRRKLEWTQVQAAVWLDVPLATYQNWEQGRRCRKGLRSASGPVRHRMNQARKESA